MKKRIVVIASLAIASFAPAAWAEEQQQEQGGVTSGPASGSPVEPSGSVQKENPQATGTEAGQVSGPSGTSAGAPGVEGKKGTQSGQEWSAPEEIKNKKH